MKKCTGHYDTILSQYVTFVIEICLTIMLSTHTHKLSPSRKLHSTAVGTIMLSHDASVRMSDAANSSVRFSSSITYTTEQSLLKRTAPNSALTTPSNPYSFSAYSYSAENFAKALRI